LKYNGTIQLVIYAVFVNLLGGNINTVQKNVEATLLIDASKEVGLKMNAEKT
jgi:hypothetical protein